MATETFPAVAPSRGSRLTRATAVLEARFGDGYTQAAADGINATRRRYAARWEALPSADADRIEAFLARHGGWKPFLFQPPSLAAAVKWRCKSWDRERLSATHATMRAEFEEDFSL